MSGNKNELVVIATKEILGKEFNWNVKKRRKHF